jgi:HAD superfamily hydrolase (TIGR01549 family)
LTQAVIFDLDGTLINLPIDYDSLFREFAQIMKTPRVRPLTETIPKLSEAKRKKVFLAWERNELEAFEDATANEEGMSIYREFAQKPKTLVTMQGRNLVKNVLQKLGLRFDFTVTREDSLDRREQLEIAAKKLKAPFEKILFVGDTLEDGIAAKEVGCRFVRVGE